MVRFGSASTLTCFIHRSNQVLHLHAVFAWTPPRAAVHHSNFCLAFFSLRPPNLAPTQTNIPMSGKSRSGTHLSCHSAFSDSSLRPTLQSTSSSSPSTTPPSAAPPPLPMSPYSSSKSSSQSSFSNSKTSSPNNQKISLSSTKKSLENTTPSSCTRDSTPSNET